MTTSGSLGLLFPPSLPIILYSIVSKVNIDQLFRAALVPGILLIVVLSIYSVRVAVKAGVPRQPFRWRTVLRGPERGGVGNTPPVRRHRRDLRRGHHRDRSRGRDGVLRLVVEVFIRRDLKFFRDLPKALHESMILVGAILVMLGMAMGVTNYLIDEQIPMKLFAFVNQFVASKVVFLSS